MQLVATKLSSNSNEIASARLTFSHRKSSKFFLFGLKRGKEICVQRLLRVLRVTVLTHHRLKRYKRYLKID